MNAFDELAARYKIRARKTIKLFEMITNALAVRPEPLDTTMRTLLVAYMEDVTDTYSRLARVPGEDPDFLVMCSELGKSAERTKRVLEQSDLPVPAV